MTLQDFINTAKYSELNSLAIKSNDNAIISFVNLGLIELYARFALRTEEYLIELLDNVTIYDMPANFMYLVGAYEEVPKNTTTNVVEVPVNEENNPFSVNTINYKQVQIPLSVAGGYISLLYVPKPEVVTEMADELPIPEQMVTPLLAYVAYKGHASVKATGENNDTGMYWSRFEKACEKLKELGVGVTPDDMSMSDRIRMRGFV